MRAEPTLCACWSFLASTTFRAELAARRPGDTLDTMRRRLPLHVVASFLLVHAVAFDVIVRCLMSDGHVGRFVTASAAAGLVVGATSGMLRRTWGVGLMLASATSFFAAGALEMGPPFFFAVAAAGALPFVLTVKYMARFDIGATILFALLAGVLGLGAALSWDALAPTVIPMFAH
jgi:hypothetical protein